MTEKTEKAVNYTDEMVQAMTTAYNAAETDEARKAVVVALAAEFGKKPASVVAKLVSLNVYKAPTAKGKTGEKPIKKDELVDLIASFIGVPADKLPGLEKANKSALQVISTAFNTANEIIADYEAIADGVTETVETSETS